MKLGPITDFFENLKDGYYHVENPNRPDRRSTCHWFKGDLIIYEVFPDHYDYTTLAVSIPLLDAYPTHAHGALDAMIAKGTWTPITKSDFVELLDQSLPD